jgi:hypothetical protein
MVQIVVPGADCSHFSQRCSVGDIALLIGPLWPRFRSEHRHPAPGRQ